MLSLRASEPLLPTDGPLSTIRQAELSSGVPLSVCLPSSPSEPDLAHGGQSRSGELLQASA